MILDTPKDLRPLRIIGFDPGSDTLGVAIADLNYETNLLTFVYVKTFLGSKLALRYPHIAEAYGDKAARLWGLRLQIMELLKQWNVDDIASEAPYLGRFATAYAALVECISAIRAAVASYDSFTPLNLYDPPSVKLAVGAPGKSKDKNLVAVGLSNLSFVRSEDIGELTALDEHSTDAMAVCVKHARTLLELPDK